MSVNFVVILSGMTHPNDLCIAKADMNPPILNYEELRPLTFEALRVITDPEQANVITTINAVEKILLSRGIHKDNEEYIIPGRSERHRMPTVDREKVRQIINELVIEGVLSWGTDEMNTGLPWFTITEYGRSVIDNGTPQPYDPDGFLAYLKSRVSNIDDIIIIYMTEALQTLRRNNLLSAAVMTGVASERAFELLLDAIAKSVTGPGQTEKFEKLKNDTRTKRRFDEVKRVIMQKIPEKKRNEIDENLESDLDGNFNLIRITRNDAGHPTGKIPRREQVFVNLQLFVPYCICVYGLIDYLKTNNI
jgi:hypothetical protein